MNKDSVNIQTKGQIQPRSTTLISPKMNDTEVAIEDQSVIVTKKNNFELVQYDSTARNDNPPD